MYGWAWSPVAILFSLLCAELAPAQEFCGCTGTTFTWAGCGADGHCDPGQWTNCTPSPDDGYAFQNGCHVTIDGGDLLLSHASPRHVSVKSGASFTMRGPAELRLGPMGVRAEPGSRVDLSGCFRHFWPMSAGKEECAPTVTAAALFPIGRVLPCRDGDCNGDAETVRLDWAHTDPGLDAPIDALLDRIDAARDAICFWQHSESAPAADSGYCYAVTAVGRDGGERFLDFDIRQTWSAQSDQAGYPLTRREVHPATLASDAPAGTRELTFSETGLVEGRAGPAGRFLRCDGEQQSHLIATATDDPAGDVLTLADARGTTVDYGAGTLCHIDWGWAEWDVAFIMAPVHVTAHTPQVDRTRVFLEGETTLRGVVVDGLGGELGVLYGAALEVRGGPLVALEHVWVVDPLVANRASVLLDDLPCGTSVRHLVVTGGPSDAEGDKNYGLAWFGGSTCEYTVEHLYTRFMGDDNFVLESSGTRPTGTVHIRYAQAGPSSFPGDSGQFFDFGAPNPTLVSVRDALCTSCTSHDGRDTLIAPSAGNGHIENLLWVGVHNGGLVTSGAEPDDGIFTFERFGVIGSDVDASNALGAGPLTGLVSDRFYVRDIQDPRANPSRLCAGPASGARTRLLSRGIFSNVTLGSVPCEVSHASLSDLYFVDVARSTPGALLLAQSWASNLSLSRLTVAFTRPPSGLQIGVSAPFVSAAPELTIDGLLLTGLRGATTQAMSLGYPATAALVSWGAPTCFFDNAIDESPAVLAAYGVAPVQSVDPAFVNPAAGRFDLAPASPLAGVGCGAREAGYSEFDWAHRKAKLAPMYMGDRPLACGLLGVELLLPLVLVARRGRRRQRGRIGIAAHDATRAEAAHPGLLSSSSNPRLRRDASSSSARPLNRSITA